MPDDFARTQAQIAAQWPLPAPVSASHAEYGSSPVQPVETSHNGVQHHHDRPGMIPRDPLNPPVDNLTNQKG